jgi:regulation of enolase protein 1 (concanavalin A-like superfamily)
MTEAAGLTSMPFDLRWEVPPVDWAGDGDATLTITAGPRTDMFVDPRGIDGPTLNAPRLLGSPDADGAAGDYLLGARVRVGFSATYDAGVLLVYGDERSWAKLCFECSPDGRPMIVSVVTRGVSDDANAFEVDGDQVWLRVARLGRAYAFHASTDGTAWRLVRHFALAPGGPPPRIGFEAQSPTGGGCTATFERIRFARERLGDLRSGE